MVFHFSKSSHIRFIVAKLYIIKIYSKGAQGLSVPP